MTKRSSETELNVRIVVKDPPPGVRFQIQRGAKELAPPAHATSETIVFEFPVRVGRRNGQPNFLGPFTQGPPAARFVYVNSGTCAGQSGTCWSRRAKVPLGGISWQLIDRAQRESAALEIAIDGTGRDGGPSCGTIRVLSSDWRVSRGSRSR